MPPTAQPAPENEKQPAISLPDDVGTTIAQRAASVKTEIAKQRQLAFRTYADWLELEYDRVSV